MACEVLISPGRECLAFKHFPRWHQTQKELKPLIWFNSLDFIDRPKKLNRVLQVTEQIICHLLKLVGAPWEEEEDTTWANRPFPFLITRFRQVSSRHSVWLSGSGRGSCHSVAEVYRWPEDWGGWIQPKASQLAPRHQLSAKLFLGAHQGGFQKAQSL